MSNLWNSLYCRSDDAGAVVEKLRETLTNLGYTLYNPFGALPGKAYPQSVRLFVGLPVNGWVRVIGEPDVRQLPMLSQSSLCLYCVLDGAAAHIEVYVDGQPADLLSGLISFLRPGRTLDDLTRALQVRSDASISHNAKFPLAALPDDVQSMAGGVNPAQAQKMFQRLSGNLMKKVVRDPSQADAARALVTGSTVDWNSAGGQSIRALLDCLMESSVEPDFTALRDAYQLHERKRRSPNARLYPGDAEAMAKVPDALDYIPVYGGML